ncbi:MAG: CCA tRNA nucleotidyltransferase [Simkaniaceae bacterium]|nr:CCA tRNA nucleotidyltransferase [Simkaniaceae bacterium]MCF7852305.1 CCA tRNA nucleotidyltransferase [Simkaniaceae bacterium]
MPEHYRTAVSIVQKLHNQGFTTYFAGGWVRDHLLNFLSDDIDIVTDASVDELRVLFEKTIPVGEQFGIVIVLENGYRYEIATFRKETGYEDGRRPTQVTSATPEEDAGRRDFTINGMFFDPLSGEIYDYIEGKKDIEAKIIRAIGDPHMRFKEDRLRMLRAIRYSCRFGFKIEENTYQAIIAHHKELFPAVAIERVWQEFTKMAAFPHLDQALMMLYETGLLSVIFPSLTAISKTELLQSIEGIENLPMTTSAIAKIILLFTHMSQQQLEEQLKQLKLSNKEVTYGLYFAKLKQIFEQAPPLTRSELVYLYADVHFELCFEILKCLPIPEATIAKHTHQHIKLFPHVERVIHHRPIITAELLMAAGLPPGKELGDLLKKAESISIEEDLLDQDAILDRILPPNHRKQ